MTDDVNKILSERKNSHGDFSDHALITANLKMSMHITAGWGRLIPVQSEALDMIAHKIGRILAGDPNFKDHWDDIAGYATLVANRCSQPVMQWIPEETARMKSTTKPDNPITSEKSYCAQCDGCMRVDTAGYVMCQFKGCPNAGKKVL